MNEKFLSAVGAGLILISFGVIVSFFIITGVETKVAEENQTINFQQLGEFTENTPSKLKNTTVVQEFRKYVGDTIEVLKEKAILENTTLFAELKNSTAVNGTQ